MKDALQAAVDAERFNMRALSIALLPLIEAHAATGSHLGRLKQQLQEERYLQVVERIVRHIFLIELVKQPGQKTTKMRVRWFEELEGDPRGCSFEECVEIAGGLVSALADGWLTENQHREALDLFLECPLVAHELPLDYVTVPAPASDGQRLHESGNIGWICTDTILRTLRLRKFLRDPASSPDPEFFGRVLKKKIAVKTYLTDRAQTGLYKTNREKRWETHPFSVQFATRAAALEIEHALVTQLCRFEAFPMETQQLLQREGILPAIVEVVRCPVTLEPLSFPAFRAEVMEPVHGESRFHVGHLHPLKLDQAREAGFGHTAANITWISEDGNRIQGKMAIEEVQALLQRIARNYAARGT